MLQSKLSPSDFCDATRYKSKGQLVLQLNSKEAKL